MGGITPLDHPTPERPHRVYLALTNHCNRSCPWCSTCSSPLGQTFLPLEALAKVIPGVGPFELQLEGGEPTLHPAFWGFVDEARAHPRCTRLVVCTNGVVLPRTRARLAAWIERLGAPLTLKLSVNHHLLERDAGLITLAKTLAILLPEADDSRLLVLNVRLRRTVFDADQAVLAAVDAAGLRPRANVFWLQRYGLAEDEHLWEPPFVVGEHFTLVNPDGQVLGQDLIARSEAMRSLLDFRRS